MTTLEQVRMRKAWEALVATFGAETHEWSGKRAAEQYRNHLKSTPARIHTSGLGQALAFLKSRGDSAAANAYTDVSRLTRALLGTTPQGDLLNDIRSHDAPYLYAATGEALAVIEWLTRYLEGEGVGKQSARRADNNAQIGAGDAGGDLAASPDPMREG
jgi:CRISPR-associated protein Cmr5